MRWIFLFSSLSLLLSACVSLPTSPRLDPQRTTTEPKTGSPMTTTLLTASVEEPRGTANLAALLFLCASGLIIVGVAAVTKTLPWTAALLALASAAAIAILPDLVDITNVTLKAGILGLALGGLAISGWRVYSQYKKETNHVN